MKRFHMQWARRSIILLMAGILSGCYEVIPQKIEQSLDIDRSGKVSLSYGGSFLGQGQVLLVKSKGRDTTLHAKEIADADQQALDVLGKLPGKALLRRDEAFHYTARWLVRGDLKQPEQLSELLLGKHPADGKIPVPVYLQQVGATDTGFSIQSDILRSESDWNTLKSVAKDRRTPEARAVAEMVNGIDVTLNIDIARDLVVQSNAPVEKELPSGRVRYSWHWTPTGAYVPIQFAFALDKQDIAQLKLLTAKPGTSCENLIGQDCKCGPFTLVERNGGPVPHAPYELHVDSDVFRGCTDAEGNTQTVTVKITGGECGVAWLPPKASAKLCRKTDSQ